MSAVRRSLHDAIDRMDENQACEALALIRQLQRKQSVASAVGVLRGNPTFQLPTTLGEPFPEVEPLPTNGVSATDLLVADRR